MAICVPSACRSWNEKSMDQEERRRDQKLATFTDALLEGQAEPELALNIEEESDRPPLADTVERLSRALSPQSLPASLHHKLRRLIATEWPRQRPSLFQRLLQPFRQPIRRWAWAPAAVLILIAVIVALLPASASEVTATATGEVGVVVLVILLVLAGVLVTVWLVFRRDH